MRKPVTAFLNEVGNLLVICDDGTMWLNSPETNDEAASWIEIEPPIPGSSADTSSN